MRSSRYLALGSSLVVLATCTPSCSPSTLSSFLSGNQSAQVLQAYEIANGGTFEVPISDVAYPQSPTDLPLPVRYTSMLPQVRSRPTRSDYFCLYNGISDSCKLSRKRVIFKNSDLIHAFRAVGNGGFAGGVYWADMVCFVLVTVGTLGTLANERTRALAPTMVSRPCPRTLGTIAHRKMEAGPIMNLKR